MTWNAARCYSFYTTVNFMLARLKKKTKNKNKKTVHHLIKLYTAKLVCESANVRLVARMQTKQMIPTSFLT